MFDSRLLPFIALSLLHGDLTCISARGYVSRHHGHRRMSKDEIDGKRWWQRNNIGQYQKLPDRPFEARPVGFESTTC